MTSMKNLVTSAIDAKDQ